MNPSIAPTEKTTVIMMLILLLFAPLTSTGFAADAITEVEHDPRIVVDAAAVAGTVNDQLFGNCIVGYDPDTIDYIEEPLNYRGHMDFGEGIWNPAEDTWVPEVMALAKKAGISVIRFPGGDGVKHYDWKNAIGPERTEFLFGIHEVFRVAEELNAELLMGVSYFVSNPGDAADFVEYLNAPNDGTNPNGGVDWAAVRADNGREAPFGVTYFELDNEPFHGDHQYIDEVTPGDYANAYVAFRAAMKTVDASVQLGLALDNQVYNQTMIGIIGENLDFVIGHTYPNPGIAPEEYLTQNPNDGIFHMTYTRPYVLFESVLAQTRRMMNDRIGKTVPFAVTEYNSGFVQDKPVPYRYSLGTALLISDMLRMFMKPQNDILMANFWNLSTAYWGMIKTDEDITTFDYSHPIRYTKRPNYYVFELYQKHFGTRLLAPEVTSSTFQLHPYVFKLLHDLVVLFAGEEQDDEPPLVPYLTANASLDESGDNLYLMVVNRHMFKSYPTPVEIRNFLPAAAMDVWTLHGNSIDATNETHALNVRLRHRRIDLSGLAGESVTLTFEPHSITAVTIAREIEVDAEGTTYIVNADGSRTGYTQDQRTLNLDAEGRQTGFLDNSGNTFFNNDDDGTITGYMVNNQVLEFNSDMEMTSLIDASRTVYNGEPDGTIRGITLDGRVVRYTSDWRLISIVDALGRLLASVDDEGRLFEFHEDGSYSIRDTDGSLQNYSETGALTAISNADGDLVWRMDADGNSYEYLDDGGVITRMPDGSVFKVDADQRLVMHTNALGDIVVFQDADGTVFARNEDNTISAETVDGTLLKYAEDWALLWMRTVDGTEYSYASGNLVQIVKSDGTVIDYHADGTFTETTPEGWVTDFNGDLQPIRRLDPEGRLVMEVTEEGVVVTYDADGGRQERHPSGRTVVFAADGRMIQVRSPAGTVEMIGNPGLLIVIFQEGGSRVEVLPDGRIYGYDEEGVLNSFERFADLDGDLAFGATDILLSLEAGGGIAFDDLIPLTDIDGDGAVSIEEAAYANWLFIPMNGEL